MTDRQAERGRGKRRVNKQSLSHKSYNMPTTPNQEGRKSGKEEDGGRPKSKTGRPGREGQPVDGNMYES